MNKEVIETASPYRRVVFVLVGVSILMGLFQQDPLLFSLSNHNWQHEPWRLWTAHLVHVNELHLGLNLLGLFSLLFFFQKHIVTALMVTIIFFAPIISLILSVTLPEGSQYYGFSGLLHTLYISLAINILSSPKDRLWGAALITLFSIKLISDLFSRGLTHALINATVSNEVHQMGAIAGLLLGAAFVICKFSYMSLRKVN